MDERNFILKIERFIEVYQDLYDRGCTSMSEVAKELGCNMNTVYRTVAKIRAWEKRNGKTVLPGPLTQKHQMEKMLNGD